MKKGDISTDVMTLQRNLQKLGYGTFVPTGFFGDKTYQAVLSYQKNLGLPQTGIFGQPEASRVNSELIYRVSKLSIGVDVSPNDLAPDEYGCADSVCGVLFKTFANPQIDWTIATSQLYGELLLSKGYIQTQTPVRGDIVISPTGYGITGKVPNGHTGIVGDNCYMSNNSLTGNWDTHLDKDSWNKRYVILGGYPVYFFHKL